MHHGPEAEEPRALCQRRDDQPPSATGARKWGEFVSAGGSPNPELPSQRLAVPIPESSLTFVWVGA